MPNWLYMIAVRFEPGSSHTAVGADALTTRPLKREGCYLKLERPGLEQANF